MKCKNLRYIETDLMKIAVIRSDPYTITDKDIFIIDEKPGIGLEQMRILQFTLPAVDKKLDDFMKPYNERLI